MRKDSVAVDQKLFKGIIEMDALNSMPDDLRKKYHGLYLMACELRELRFYKLLRRVIAALNESAFKSKAEKLRLVDEGAGLYIELG